MELLQKHKILFFSLIIVNLIITIASYFVFNTYSYKGPTNTEESYQKLLRLNNEIKKSFQQNLKKISKETDEKVKKIKEKK